MGSWTRRTSSSWATTRPAGTSASGTASRWATSTSVYARDIWSLDNPDGTFPGVAANPHNSDNPAGNDFNLRDASFVRLSNVTLGYRLPQTLVDRLGSTRSARLYVDVRNLGVLTDYPGFDPEYTEPNPYPKFYSATIGVDVEF